MVTGFEKEELEAYRAYYKKIQGVISQIKKLSDQIDLDECAKIGPTQAVLGASIKTAYEQCAKMIANVSK